MKPHPDRSPLALVILSGGQDSTTCLALAIKDYGLDNVYAVTFDYGQRHRVEIDCAYSIAILVGISSRWELINCAGILKGFSPLVNDKTKVDTYSGADALPGGLEKTFVPMRNQLFLTLAYNRAVMLGLTVAPGHVFDVDLITGVSQEDYGGYPDCRAPFIAAVGRAGDLALDAAELPLVTIRTPLMFLNKRQTVDLSESMPGARKMLAYSHTCYNGVVPPCGKCHACLLRSRGYSEAGVIDPLLERLDSASADTALRHHDPA